MKLEDFSKTPEKSKSATPKKESIWNRDISFGGDKLTDKHKSTFYHQLKTLINSGVDIRSALELVMDQFKSKNPQLLSMTLLRSWYVKSTVSGF